MELAELFAVVGTYDATATPAGAAALLSGFVRGEADDRELRETLWQRSTATVEHAARLVDFLLRDFDVPQTHRAALHDLAVLCLASRREETVFASGAPEAELAALGSSSADPSATPAGPRGRYAAGIVEALRDAPGWAIGSEALLQRIAGTVGGIGQEFQLHQLGGAAAMGPSLGAFTQGAWQETLLEAASVIAGDSARGTRSAVADEVGRRLGAVVGLAGAMAGFLDDERADHRAVELVTQRFAIASHVVKLSEPQIARSLRATLELEVRDLLDAVGHLPKSCPRRIIARRQALAVLSADGSSRAVVEATKAARPSRGEVMDLMRAIARADGKITADERALLRGLDAQLHDFSTLVERIEEDRVVDFEEFQQLRDTRQRMLDELFRIALADATVSDDERQLLLRAMELLPTLRTHVPHVS